MSPVRLNKNHGGNGISRFPSVKMERMISTESRLESDFVFILDFERDVERFEEQPFTLEYMFEDQTLHYTPDFHVVRSGRNYVVECKPLAFVDSEENRRKFEAALRWCAEREWIFCVVIDQELRAGFYLANVKFLTRYARYHLRVEMRGRLLAILEDVALPLALDRLAEMAAPADKPAAIASILHMAYCHQLALPLRDAPLSKDSPVSLPRPGQDDDAACAALERRG